MVHLIADDFVLNTNIIKELTLFLNRIYTPEYYEINIIIPKKIKKIKEKKEDIFETLKRNKKNNINENNISDFAKTYLNENNKDKPKTEKITNKKNESYYLNKNWEKITFGLNEEEVLIKKKFNSINNFNFKELQNDWIIKSPEFEIEQRKDTYILLITCKNKSTEFNEKLKKAITDNFKELKIRKSK